MEIRNKLSQDFIKLGDKTFSLDFVTCKWYGLSQQETGRTDRCIYYWRRILKDERPVPDRVVLEIPFTPTHKEIYRQIFPFRLDRDECRSWIKWEVCPADTDFKFNALSLIDPDCDPHGPQPRGVANFFDIWDTKRLLTEFKQAILDESGEGAGLHPFVSSFHFAQRLFSLTGFTDLTPPDPDDFSFLYGDFPPPT